MATAGADSGLVAHITDESFKADVLEHDKPVLVDFWAEWCPPCKMIAPLLEEIAKEHGDEFTIRKINTDQHPKTPASLQVTSLPTLMLFDKGEVVARLVGARPKAKLLKEINDALHPPG